MSDGSDRGGLRDDELETLVRPDSELPPELRHKKIREVRDVSSATQWAFQIVFDQHWLPYSYWNPKPDGWEMTYARTEYHNGFDGLLGMLLPDKECITIVVTHDRDQDIFGDLGGEDSD